MICIVITGAARGTGRLLAEAATTIVIDLETPVAIR